ALVVGLSIGQAIGYLLGRRFGLVARRARLGGLDATLGAIFGAAAVLLFFWIAGTLLAAGPVRPLAGALGDSLVLRRMNEASRPPDVLAYLRQYLNTADFPQVFAGVPRPLDEPVALPAGKLARRAITAAAESTVRVVVPACDGTQLGSGWIAADSTVVTNAHVVAGGDELSVEDDSGSHPGTVVLFDPNTDVAVVRAEGLSGPPLELTTEALDRGAVGATLGYPGDANGGLDAQRAAVQKRFVALGKDIYARSDAPREVYELRSRVVGGDSGGPFVLPSGKVAGMVFAAATTDSGVGYALTGREISAEVASGTTREEAVSTGQCTH
ncbi:MAG: MarP family serine protease, partial [Actinobacteria bacterium]|nr:MarP family serine protease [Actinomycetota bacterium]